MTKIVIMLVLATAVTSYGTGWLGRELARLRRYAKELDIPTQWVDRLIVLDRRIINCVEGRGHDSARSGRSALQIWFAHLLNYLRREDERRKGIDIDIYGGAKIDGWRSQIGNLREKPNRKDIAHSPKRKMQSGNISPRGKRTERIRKRTRRE